MSDTDISNRGENVKRSLWKNVNVIGEHGTNLIPIYTTDYIHHIMCTHTNNVNTPWLVCTSLCIRACGIPYTHSGKHRKMLTEVKELAWTKFVSLLANAFKRECPPPRTNDVCVGDWLNPFSLTCRTHIPSDTIAERDTTTWEAVATLTHSDTLWLTFFELLKLPTIVADTARWDGGRSRCNNKWIPHTRYKPSWDSGEVHPPRVNLYQGSIVDRHVRTLAPSASLNALLR